MFFAKLFAQIKKQRGDFRLVINPNKMFIETLRDWMTSKSHGILHAMQ